MSEIVVVITGATGPSGGGGGGGPTTLDDLTDVTITAAASGDILRHNGTAWVDAVGTTHFEAAGGIATHAAVTSSVHGISAFGATLVDDADAATARTTLGLGALATLAGIRVEDEGTSTVASAVALNFVGSTVTVTDAGSGEATVTISAGSGVASDSIFDAKGDLPVGTGADAAAKLAAGTNGHAVIADSSTSTGLKYGHPNAPQLIQPANGHAHATGRRTSESGMTLDRLQYIPLEVLPDHPYTTFGVRVAVAESGGTGVVRIGLYEFLPTGLPGALIIDGGTATTHTSAGFKSVAISRTMRSSMVFVGVAFQVSVTSLTASVVTNNGQRGPGGTFDNTAAGLEPSGGALFEGSVSGALPSTPSGSLTRATHSTVPLVFAY
jgi:hypothetical protein